jgi:hypothetical protein
MSVQIETL